MTIDPVAGDLLDSPRGRAEQEGLPGPRLVDHLLVELPHPAAVGQVDSVEAAVGDRAGVGDRELARPGRPRMVPGGAIPDDPRAQLGEAVGRVAAVEHVEHVLELLAGELRERLGGGDQALDLVHLPLVVGAHRDQVLGEDVERVARDHGLLDLALAHPPGDHRALEQVGAELGEDAAHRDLVERVAGAPDPLQPAGDRLRRLDLDHQVDGAHVDPELERRGGDQARELPGLQELLDHLRSSWASEPWWALAISAESSILRRKPRLPAPVPAGSGSGVAAGPPHHRDFVASATGPRSAWPACSVAGSSVAAPRRSAR